MVDRDDARLQISCSTPELHRHAQQRRAKHTKSATPVATPVYIDGGTSSSPDGARKLSRRQLAMGPHRALISDYIARNPGTETQGFVAAVRKLAARCRWFNFDFDGTRRESIEAAFPLGFLPDAFRVDRKVKELTIVEAEITSRITARKWAHIADLYWCFREDDWDVWVHTIDPRGIVFSVDTPLVALQLNEGVSAEDIAKSPPGAIVWQPSDGARPVTNHYWYDAIQRALGHWPDERQPVAADLQQRVRERHERASDALVARAGSLSCVRVAP